MGRGFARLQHRRSHDYRAEYRRRPTAAPRGLHAPRIRRLRGRAGRNALSDVDGLSQARHRRQRRADRLPEALPRILPDRPVDRARAGLSVGPGGNGKSVFMSTVVGILDDYAVTAPMEMFVATNVDRHPTEIARLKGVRLVVAHETQQGRRWDEAKIKNLTGGDKLTGRFMRGDFFDFKPTHKLMIAGNHKPSLRSVDEAIRRRFALVPFTVTHSGRRTRPASWPTSSRLSGPQFCAGWSTAVSNGGATDLRYQKSSGTRPTTTSPTKTPSLSGSMIGLTPETLNAFVPSRSLFISWKVWCEARNLAAGTETAFVDSLKDRGYEQKKTATARGFKGIALKVNDEPGAEVNDEPGAAWDVR